MQIYINDQLQEIDTEYTELVLTDIVGFISDPPSRLSLFVNGKYIPRCNWGTQKVSAQDKVDSIALVAGG